MCVSDTVDYEHPFHLPEVAVFQGSLHTFWTFQGEERNTRKGKEEAQQMELLLYAPVSQEVRKRVVDTLEPVLPENSMQVCLTLGNLCRKLQMPKQHLRVAVLVVRSPKDIMKLISIRLMFRDVRVLLVLPDTEEETIAMAHRFQPRYLTFVDKNIPALATVVDRMRNSPHWKVDSRDNKKQR
jgi:hypothetical protein